MGPITIRAYASYAASWVFAPAGVTGPDFTHDAADALAYNFGNTNRTGLSPGPYHAVAWYGPLRLAALPRQHWGP